MLINYRWIVVVTWLIWSLYRIIKIWWHQKLCLNSRLTWLLCLHLPATTLLSESPKNFQVITSILFFFLDWVTLVIFSIPAIHPIQRKTHHLQGCPLTVAASLSLLLIFLSLWLLLSFLTRSSASLSHCYPRPLSSCCPLFAAASLSLWRTTTLGIQGINSEQALHCSGLISERITSSGY